MKIFTAIWILSLLLLQPLAAASPRQVPADPLLHSWFRVVSRDDAQDAIDPRIDPLAALARFYQRHGFRPAWTDDGGLLPRVEVLIQAIRHAPGHGLRVMDYNIQNFETGLGRDAAFSGEPFRKQHDELIRLDVALTDVMLRYAAHLSGGRIQPEELANVFTGEAEPAFRDLSVELADALNENRLAEFMDSLSPRHRPYKNLEKTLQRYRVIQAAGGWPQIAEGPKLKLGDQGTRVTMLHRHLTITGDLLPDAWLPGDRFGTQLESAVKQYQRRHGLAADGIVGSQTLASLNIPIESRMIQLMLNMERWRWFPEDLGPRYIMVNIPGFDLRLVENDAEELSMRVIVGQKSRPTPVLAERLTYLEVNPYWNIPQTIARHDLLPKIQTDAGYLDRQSIRVFDSWHDDAPELDPLSIDWENVSTDFFPFRLRQDPAAYNALGRFKFMFPNRQSIYIHDTPGKYLFSRANRSFSSGCIRVEEPLKLALRLLKPQDWNQRRLAQAVESRRNRAIILEEPVPVYLVYFTAWADSQGDVHFRDDIYDLDRRLLMALFHPEDGVFPCSAIAGPAEPTGMFLMPGWRAASGVSGKPPAY